ncbi:uncharacterized protein LOC123914831 [Trifolium pratense]|uniref:uncharacterized protein LOC123914831 n=1 Tax=Trifolium pratense TaxID=57577 RepID=UPI001E69008F|nr:uncharacterized protein LOC123914831 [Trifolium pratense]
MSIISWNCRGLGNPNAVLNLKFLIRKYKPDILILYETLVHSNKTEELRYVLGFDSCFTVDREGRGGGLAVFWHKQSNCSISNFSQNHIDMEVVDARRGTWRLTGFYGYPGGSRRRDSWNFLRHLSHVSNIPWCIIGDFNDILSSDEKKGRVDRPNWLINGFRDAVLDSGLIDIHMEGYQFTWFKSLGTDRAVEEKLDRAMSSEEWCQSFRDARLECLTVTSSDHYPLWLVRDPVRIYPRSDRKFMFENAWLVDSEFDSIVRSCWQNTGVDGVVQKLDMCAATMSQWSKDNFQNLRREIDKCHKRLERAREIIFPSSKR